MLKTFVTGVVTGAGAIGAVLAVNKLKEKALLSHASRLADRYYAPGSSCAMERKHLSRCTKKEIGKEFRQFRDRRGLPNVLGETKRDAYEILESEGLNVFTREDHRLVAMGHIPAFADKSNLVELIVRHGVVVDCYHARQNTYDSSSTLTPFGR